MSETDNLFSMLRRSADPEAAAALETLMRDGSDRDLNRINALDFAARSGLREDAAISLLLHAARLGLLDMSWNVLCPSCGGVLDAAATLKSVQSDSYECAFCATGYQPTLDEMVEVVFTVNQRIRRIGAHDPHGLPLREYLRQVALGSGFDVPEDGYETMLDEITLDALELPAGEKAVLSLQLPPALVIVFEPVTHTALFLEVRGEPTRERRQIALSFNSLGTFVGTQELQPGPVRLAFDNRCESRVLPSVWVAGDRLDALLGRRKPFLTARRLLSNQTFRDLYQTDTLAVDQRLRITSLTFLFTDLRGSTELYERVGDLVAFDLVRSHFRVLLDIVAEESGAVIKTIGDAVMATFLAPGQAVAAALRMREGMRAFNAARGRNDLSLKIGIHEGPCLAVLLNDRQDFFGQTVNLASRVQGAANSTAIMVTGAIASDAAVGRLLDGNRVSAQPRAATLRGLAHAVTLYEIP